MDLSSTVSFFLLMAATTVLGAFDMAGMNSGDLNSQLMGTGLESGMGMGMDQPLQQQQQQQPLQQQQHPIQQTPSPPPQQQQQETKEKLDGGFNVEQTKTLGKILNNIKKMFADLDVKVAEVKRASLQLKEQQEKFEHQPPKQAPFSWDAMSSHEKTYLLESAVHYLLHDAWLMDKIQKRLIVAPAMIYELKQKLGLLPCSRPPIAIEYLQQQQQQDTCPASTIPPQQVHQQQLVHQPIPYIKAT